VGEEEGGRAGTGREGNGEDSLLTEIQPVKKTNIYIYI